jgi:hypothetical protein
MLCCMNECMCTYVDVCVCMYVYSYYALLPANLIFGACVCLLLLLLCVFFVDILDIRL